MAVTERKAPTYLLEGDNDYPLQYFVADERHSIEKHAMPMGLETDEKIRSFTAALWEKTYRSMEPEHDRMKRNELYYSGFHFATPEENLEMEVTNYPWSIVETVHPELTERKPRPEIQTGSGVSDGQARLLNQYATWLMNTNGFDTCYRLGSREMLKLGWNMDLITFDHSNGMPYPKCWNNWNFYPDFTASHEDDMLYFFLAAPVSTRYLKAMFPAKADSIKSDAWVSPSYDVLVRPYQEMQGMGSRDRSVVPYAAPFGETPPAGSTSLSPPGGVRGREGGATSFLFQLFIRDLTHQDVIYSGKRWKRDHRGLWNWHWDHQTIKEPCCDSGWRVVQMTADGTVLDVAPLDRCFAGLPITMGRDYEQAFRMFCPGEIDHVISKTKAITRRLNLLNQALEYQANPPILADKNAGTDFDKGAILAGDVLRRTPGSRVEWMDARGPGEQQFLMLQGQRNDIDVISGVHDVLQGQRPPGIEAGVAIQSLQQQGKTRIRGKEAGQFAHYSLLLKKLMVCAGMKLNRRIQFRATDGELLTMDPEVLMSEYQVQFAPGSGLMSSRNDQKSEARDLYSMGVIDEQEVLEVYDWKNRGVVMQRIQARRQAEMQMRQMELAAGVTATRRSGKEAA